MAWRRYIFIYAFNSAVPGRTTIASVLSALWWTPRVRVDIVHPLHRIQLPGWHIIDKSFANDSTIYLCCLSFSIFIALPPLPPSALVVLTYCILSTHLLSAFLAIASSFTLSPTRILTYLLSSSQPLIVHIYLYSMSTFKPSFVYSKSPTSTCTTASVPTPSSISVLKYSTGNVQRREHRGHWNSQHIVASLERENLYIGGHLYIVYNCSLHTYICIFNVLDDVVHWWTPGHSL